VTGPADNGDEVRVVPVRGRHGVTVPLVKHITS
jgi:hypothetical protein